MTDPSTDTGPSTGSTSNPAIELDLDFVRAQFPAFAHPDSAGWIHLENAGGSYVPSQVIDLLTHFYTATKVQPYGPAGPAKTAGEAMDRARQVLPATLNCGPDELHFGPSTSQNTYVLARALLDRPHGGAPPVVGEGDEIVVTNQDHEANIGSWRRMADHGVTVKEWSVDRETGLLDLASLAELLTERTRLLCMTHASNLAATINPVREAADLAHAVGALVVVDGVSWAPHASIDVEALDCDFYLYSTYKTYGPHIGLLYSRRDALARLANQGHFFKRDDPTGWLTPAGPDHAAIAASAGIADYYDALFDHHFGRGNASQVDGRNDGPLDASADAVTRVKAVFDLVADHEERLMAPVLDLLASKGVRLVGDPSPSRDVRAPTIAFASPRRPGSEVVQALAAEGIGAGAGDFYARRLVDAMDLADGVVRLSAVHYNTTDEIDRTVAALDRIL